MLSRCTRAGSGVGLEIVAEGKLPDAATDKAMVRAAWVRGLLMIAPVGHYGNVLGMSPPLVIPEAGFESGARSSPLPNAPAMPLSLIRWKSMTTARFKLEI